MANSRNLIAILVILFAVFFVNVNSVFAQSSNAYIEYASVNSVAPLDAQGNPQVPKASFESFRYIGYTNPLYVATTSNLPFATDGHWAYLQVTNPYESGEGFSGAAKVVKAISPTGKIHNIDLAFRPFSAIRIEGLDQGKSYYTYLDLPLFKDENDVYETGIWQWEIELCKGPRINCPQIDQKTVKLDVQNDAGYPGPTELGDLKFMNLGISSSEDVYMGLMHYTVTMLHVLSIFPPFVGIKATYLLDDSLYQSLELQREAADAARETAQIRLEKVANEDGTLTIKIKWYNTPQLDVSGGITYGINYDRAVIFVDMPSNIEVVDSDNPAFQESPLDGTKKLIYVYNYNDQKLKASLSPAGEINIRLQQPSEATEIKALLQLQLGPFGEYDPGVIGGALYQPWAESVRRYDIWQSDPQKVFWHIVGMQEDTIAIEGSGNGGGTQDAVPTVTVSAPSIINVGQSITITATASDDNKVNAMNIWVDGALQNGASCSGIGTAAASCSYTSPAYNSAGAHTYYAVASDNAGQTTRNPVSGERSFQVADAGAPIVTVDAYPNPVEVNKPLHLKATASDDIALRYIGILVDGQIYDGCDNLNKQTHTCEPVEIQFSTTGAHTYQAVARDYSGNEGWTGLQSFSVVSEGQGGPGLVPIVTSSISSNKVQVGQPLTISASAVSSDPIAKIWIRASIEPNFDPTVVWECSSSSCAFSNSYSIPGVYNYFIEAQTTRGYNGRDPPTEIGHHYSFEVVPTPPPDNPPTVSVSANPNSVNQGQTVTISASASDDNQLLQIEIFVDGVSTRACPVSGTSGTCSYASSSFASGTHAYYAIATDNAGKPARDPATGTKSFAVTGTGSSAPEAPRQWFIMKDMLAPRADLAAVAFNGKIWAIGGRNSNGALADVEVYNPSSNSWSSAAPLPTAKSTAAADVINGKIYVIGGDSKTYEYDATLNQWNEKAPIPISDTGSQIAVVASGNKLYAEGGGGVPWLYMFDPATNTWEQKASIDSGAGRSVESFAALNGKLYLIGGNEAGHQPSEVWRVDVYDIQTDTWQLDGIASLPKGLTHLGSTLPVQGNKIYVIGGWNGDIAGHGAQDKVYAYNFSDNKWYAEAPINIKRFELAYASLNNEIYAIGGMTPSSYSSSYYPTNERFTSDTVKPSISALAPATVNVGQPITITASAADNLQMGSIAIFVDGVQANNCTINVASGSCSYPTSYGSAGTHTYYALAVDRAGNLARYPITGARSFTVAAADTEAPTLTVLHKPASPKIGDNITMTATATDDVDISNVSLYIDEILKSSGPSWCARTLGYWNCTYPITYNTTGTHYYYAIATDTSGNSARDPISGAKSFSVVAQDATPPNVNVSHSLVAFPIATFSARAADDVGVSEINIYLDSSLINSCAVSGTYATCSAFVPAISSGSHAYYATAIDGSGKNGTSEIKEFYAGDQPPVTKNEGPIIYVLNQTNYTLTNKQNWTVEYYFTDADNYTATCSIIANSSSTGGIVTNNTLDSFTFALLDGINYWHISCSDGANSAASGIYVLTKSSTTNSSSGNNTTGGTTGGSSGSAGSGGGGGGGGGGGSSSSSKKATANKQTSATAQQTSGPAHPTPQSAPALIEQTGATEGTSAKNTAVKSAAPTGFIALIIKPSSLAAIVGVLLISGLFAASQLNLGKSKKIHKFKK